MLCQQETFGLRSHSHFLESRFKKPNQQVVLFNRVGDSLDPLTPNLLEIFISIIGILHLVLFSIAAYKLGKSKYINPYRKIILLLFSFIVNLVGPPLSIRLSSKLEKTFEYNFSQYRAHQQRN